MSQCHTKNHIAFDFASFVRFASSSDRFVDVCILAYTYIEASEKWLGVLCINKTFCFVYPPHLFQSVAAFLFHCTQINKSQPVFACFHSGILLNFECILLSHVEKRACECEWMLNNIQWPVICLMFDASVCINISTPVYVCIVCLSNVFIIIPPQAPPSWIECFVTFATWYLYTD